MRTFTSRQRRAAIALAVVALLFATFDVVGAPFATARSGVQGFFGGLYRGTDSVLGPARTWVAELPHLATDRATIADQRAQIAALQRAGTARAQNTATAAEVTRLQLQANRGGYRVLPAHVIAIGPAGSFDWTVVLDAGTRDGVRVDQTVISGPNLVGRIVRVSASSATVLLAADPDSGVGVRDLRSKQVGVAAGRGLAGYAFTGLNPVRSPKVGDVLVTGPAGKTTYVAGLTVGTVTGIHVQLDATIEATVHAAIEPTTLDLVGVVLVGGVRPSRPALTPSTAPSTAPSVAAQAPR
jgi:rod shape-determining protein MreC